MSKTNKIDSIDNILAQALEVSLDEYLEVIDNIDQEASEYIIEKAISGVFDSNTENLEIARKEFNSLL